MKRFLLLLLLLCPGLLMADHVPMEKARSVATSFFQKSNLPQTRTLQLQMVWNGENSGQTKAAAQPAFYVFNNGNGKGFVIVAADDAANPIIAYSFDQNFKTENMPDNIRGWMEGIRREINYVRENRLKATPEIKEAWANVSTQYGETVSSYKTALWDQEMPYSQSCPLIRGERAVTGCVMTALAIVMKYYSWPDFGEGDLPAYITDTYEEEIPGITLGHTYEWDNMLMQYRPGLYTQAQGEAVARLMADLGVMLEADYGSASSGTGAYTFNIPQRLPVYMKYDAGMHELLRDYYTSEEWYRIINTELLKNPVIYSGFGTGMNGGHAFVLDGFTDNRFYHVNWGWGGSNNGYFKIDNLAPYGQGVGGNGTNFNYRQAVICGMKPAAGGKAVSELSLEKYYDYSTGTRYNGIETVNRDAEFATGKSVPIKAGRISSTGERPFTGKLKFVLVDRNGTWKEDLYASTSQHPYISGLAYLDGTCIDNYPVTITQAIAPGDKIRLYYMDDADNVWHCMKGNLTDFTKWEIPVAEAADPNLDLEKTTSFDFDKANHTATVTYADGVDMSLETTDGKRLYKYVSYAPNRAFIDISQLPAGTYVIRLVLGKQECTFNITTGQNRTENQSL